MVIEILIGLGVIIVVFFISYLIGFFILGKPEPDFFICLSAEIGERIIIGLLILFLIGLFIGLAYGIGTAIKGGIPFQ